VSVKKIVVTGALGHIGSYLIRELPKTFPGVEIVMIDNMRTQRYPSLFDLPQGVTYTFHEFDVVEKDPGPLIEGADAVIHLAAITDAAGSFDMAAEVERVNLNATRRVADSCAQHGAALIHLSSTSVYGAQNDVVDEDCREDELAPQSPYAKTKLDEERLVADVIENRGLRAVSFRFGTIYGTSPGMRFHTAVNKFCWQAVMGTPLSVWRTAYDQKRPYLSLNDATQAIALFIGKDLFDGRVYNVVTENTTVRQVVNAIRFHIPDLDVEMVDAKIMNQLSYEVLCERINSVGFKPSGDLSHGVKSTINLLKNAHADFKPIWPSHEN